MVFGFISKLIFGKPVTPDVHDPMTVPIIILMSTEDLETILTTRKAELDDVVLDIIQTKNQTLYRVLNEYNCFNISIPRSDASYKKRVTTLVEAAEKSEKCAVDIKKDQKELRGYSVFVDMRLARLCVSIWNGKESSAS
jgi:hypothetical protein